MDEILTHPQSGHEVQIFETETNYNLQCNCGWWANASKASSTKMHPNRERNSFAVAIAQRHFIQHLNVWFYEEDGKPRQVVYDDDGNPGTKICNDWPNGEKK